ncbi:MAG: glycosyltransferase [Bdellovibrionota bacterium]
MVPNEITWSTVSRSRKSSFSKRIIFLGAFSPEKGGDLIDSVLPKLKSLGFDPEIWGVPGVIKHSPLTVTSFKDATELETLRSRAEGAIVCTPSLWPETFSYTFYEAIGILKTPVVVGPFGHPAKVTRDQKLGTVMKDRSANALVDAILACAKDYSKIQGRVFDTVLTENVISRQ